MFRYTKIGKDFHAERAQGIGSSDIPTLAGLTLKYGRTPYMLWRRKMGMDPPDPAGERADWGHRLEPLILARWVEKHYGRDVADEYLAYKIRGKSCGQYKTNTACKHPKWPWALSHVDLLVDGDDEPAIIEAKSAGFFGAKRDEEDPDKGYSRSDFSQNGLPAAVFLQVQWQLLTYDVRIGWVVVLIDTGEWREYGPIIADPRIQEKCLALGQRLWDLVLSKTPPKPEDWTDVATMWPVPVDKTAMIGGDDELRARDMIDRYWKASGRLKEAEAERDDIKNALGILIGENSVLTTPEGVKLATSWVQNNPASVSLSDIKEKEPELYAKLDQGGYIRRSERRELRPAKIKAN